MSDHAFHSMDDLDEGDWSHIEQAMEQLDAAWSHGIQVEIAEQAITDKEPLRTCMQIQLIKVDQEWRWRLGQQMLVEDYLKIWPHLAENDAILSELLAAEYQNRGSFDRFPDRNELAARFPEITPRIDLHAIQERVAREQLTFDDMGHDPLVVGQWLGRYRIVDSLGCGGMGVVYRAWDSRLDIHVALKLPKPGIDPDALQRFLREAQVLAKIQHPNVCPIYDVGSIDSKSYISMALVEGRSLSQHIADSELSLDHVIMLISKLCRALARVHEEGIVHRDVKPSNVLINASDEPVLMDFGLAGRLGSDRRPRGDTHEAGSGRIDATETQVSVVGGTPGYVSPEQIAGGKVDGRSDIYSTGVVLYKALTGTLPFRGSVPQVIKGISEDAPIPPSQLKADVPAALEVIALKAMAGRPDDRYQNADEMADALDEFLTARHVPAQPRVGKNLKLALATTLSSALFLALFLALFAFTGTGDVTIAFALPAVSDYLPDVLEISIDGKTREVNKKTLTKEGAVTVKLPVGNHTIRIVTEEFDAEPRTITIRWRKDEQVLEIPIKEAGPETIATGTNVRRLIEAPDGKSLIVRGEKTDFVDYVGEIALDQPQRLREVEFKFDAELPPPSPTSFFYHKGVAANRRFLFVTTDNWPYSKYILRIDRRDGSQERFALDPFKSGPFPVFPVALAMSPDEKHLVVAAGMATSLTKKNRRLYICDLEDSQVKQVRILELEDQPIGEGMPFTADSRFVYCLTDLGDASRPKLHKVQLAPECKIVTTFDSGRPAGNRRFTGVTYSNRTNRIYLADSDTRSVQVLDGDSLRPLPDLDIDTNRDNPHQLAIYEPGRLLAVSVNKRDYIYLVNTSVNKIVGRMRLSNPSSNVVDLQFSHDGHRLYLALDPNSRGIAGVDTSPFLCTYVFVSNRAGGRDLYTMDGSGRHVRRVTHGTDNVWSPRWSPNGSQLACFSTQSKPGNKDATLHVCIVDSSTGATRVLQQTCPCDDSPEIVPLAWSPDGQRIVYIYTKLRSRLDVVDVKSGETRPLLTCEEVQDAMRDKRFKDHRRFEGVSWARTPYGESIVFSLFNPDSGYSHEIFRLDLPSRKITRLTNESGKARIVSQPNLSRDGDRIVVTRQLHDLHKDQHLEVFGTDGSQMTMLATAGDGHCGVPTWLPDGSAVVFTAEIKGHRHLFQVDVASGAVEQLTRGWASGDFNDYSPDVCTGAVIIPPQP